MGAELEFVVAGVWNAWGAGGKKSKVQLSMCEALRDLVITTNPKRLHII